MNLINTWVGYLTLLLFIIAYMLVVFEEKIHLRKSKPVVLIGCLMWLFIGVYEIKHEAHHASIYSYKEGSTVHFEVRHEGGALDFVEHLIAEIGALFFFLLVAMTYINTLSSLNVFQALRAWLISKGLGFRALFWATGIITFFLSPLADNLTSALLMSTVALAVSDGNRKFIVPTFVGIIVAANAGGAWSPFGDITTLMVWTRGMVETQTFCYLMIPSVVNYIVPALIMSFFIPKGNPSGGKEMIAMKPGAKRCMLFFALTIATAVSFHQFLDLPPFLGMMTGLGYLMFAQYYMKKWGEKNFLEKIGLEHERRKVSRYEFFKQVEQVEFDTLLFFFGVLTAVGALSYVGYLSLVGGGFYEFIGYTSANTAVGVLSAIVDNIPIMYAVLNMDLAMGVDQWLLVTLTAGVGGSLLSIGSAAGVAVMGVNRENYTFLSHLKWTPAIALGYAASIFTWWLVTMGMR
ncbi:MAG: Na(+)/H(+) antiporter NhaD [Candidatus Scalindua rubra]|uniref:Na(+)/H(+) antiporter NhaD n=1 Tax=Candidatus Scalindua rubra TaxID=1872076 RepID=A0A1E3X598_9BACT|nr:MAG: Na(+)/H(+) antiporter NhaD [Candidatus Scalindua rubra]